MLPHVCVYPARGFCRFRFQIDDMVIVHDPNKLSNPIPGFHLHRYSEKNRSILLFGLSAYKAYHFSCVEFALPNWSQPGYRLDRDIWGATIQESIWLQKKKDPTDILIDVDETSTLWIRYIHIEGLNVFISTDCLGVREIHIMRPGDTPTIQPTPGVGWNIHRFLTLPFCFKGHFDGLKLRRLRIPEFHHLDIEFSPSGRILHQTRFCDLIWSTIPKPLAIFPSPGSPGEHVRIDRNQNDGQQLSNIVQHIDFNKPGTSGYSFCGYRDNLIEIIPNDNESLPFDVAHAEGGLFPLWWMYLSLDEGERISELWERIYSTGTQW
ncbi:unnamed protein product [Fusarium graminearum]|nr:unnamed protein product [Fusarium graminearum]